MVDPGIKDYSRHHFLTKQFLSELILSMFNVCYSTDEDVKSLQTQAHIHFVLMCAGMLMEVGI